MRRRSANMAEVLSAPAREPWRKPKESFVKHEIGIWKHRRGVGGRRSTNMTDVLSPPACESWRERKESFVKSLSSRPACTST